MLQIDKRLFAQHGRTDSLSLVYEYISLRQFAKAHHYLSFVAEDQRKQVRYFLARALYHLYQYEFEVAKDWAAIGLQTHAISEMLLQMFINCCLILDEHKSAEIRLEIALNAHPANSVFYFQEAYLAWKMEDYDLATRSLAAGKNLNPDAAIGFYLDTIIAVRKLKLDTAHRHAKQLIKGDLYDSNSYTLMGHILRLKNQTKLAGRCFKRAIELYSPANEDAIIPVAHDLLDKRSNPLPFHIGGIRGWEFSAEKIKTGGFFSGTLNVTPSTQFHLFREFERHKNNFYFHMYIKMQLKSGTTFRIGLDNSREGFSKMHEVTYRLQSAYHDSGPYPSAEIIRAYLT